MKRTLIIVMLLCGMAVGTFAQIEVKGLVKELDSQQPLEFANIILQDKDSAFIQGVTTDMQGKFILKNIQQGDYHLAVSSMGFEKQYIDLMGLSRNTDLGEIEMGASAHELKAVTVSASNLTSRSDKKIVFPTDRHLQASTNGLDLLSQLMLPKLQVNPLFNTVALPGGGELQLRINGVKVEEADIVALIPSDIIRIEYYDNPGLRYGNAEVVLNYIVRRPETGGSIGVDLRNGLNTVWGTDQVSAKINHKKSEFGINYNINPREFHEMWRDNEEIFNLGNGKQLHRLEEGEPGHMKMNWQNLNLNYSYQEPDKYLFNATFRYHHNNQPHYDYDGILRNVDNQDDFVYMLDHSSNKTQRPALDLYYQHNLKNDQTLVLNVVGTYNHTTSNRTYQESRDNILLTDVNNNVTGDKYSIIGEGIYEKKLGNNRISAGLRHTQSFSDNEYKNGSFYTTHMNQSDSYLYSEFRGRAKKLDYTLGVGVSRYWFKQRNDDDSYDYYTFRPRLTLQYNLPSSSFIRLNASIYNTTPSLSDLSAIDQTIDSLQIQRGNPNLKPYLRYNVSLTYEIQKKLFYGNLWGSYEYAPKAIMEEKFLEGDKIIQTWDNQKNWKRLAGRVNTRFGPFADIIQLSTTVGVNHYMSNGNSYSHEYTNWYFNGSVSATYKKFTMMFMLETNWNWFWGETLDGGENIHLLMVNYKHKNLSVGIGAFNPFVDNYKVKSENWSEYASYKKAMYINESSRMFVAQVTYNFSFGRTYKSGNKRLNNADSDTGVMSTGK